jgi:hypothetical protein
VRVWCWSNVCLALHSQKKSQRFVNLLAATCTVNGKPIISNQRLITELLFSPSVSAPDSPDRLTIPIRMQPEADGVESGASPASASSRVVEVMPTTDYFSRGGGPQWVPLHTFLADCDDDLFGCGPALLSPLLTIPPRRPPPVATTASPPHSPSSLHRCLHLCVLL